MLSTDMFDIIQTERALSRKSRRPYTPVDLAKAAILIDNIKSVNRRVSPTTLARN
jgi:hypothetical protein